MIIGAYPLLGGLLRLLLKIIPVRILREPFVKALSRYLKPFRFETLVALW